MRTNYFFTSESVSEGHPDKVCDRISDEIVDLIYREAVKTGVDPWSVRVACETLATTNRVVIAGEVRLPPSLMKKDKNGNEIADTYDGVAMVKALFADLNKDVSEFESKKYEKAYERACVEVSHIRKAFRSKHWQECVGSSGTLQAIGYTLSDPRKIEPYAHQERELARERNRFLVALAASLAAVGLIVDPTSPWTLGLSTLVYVSLVTFGYAVLRGQGTRAALGGSALLALGGLILFALRAGSLLAGQEAILVAILAVAMVFGIARQMLLFGRPIDSEELMDRLSKITVDRLTDLAQRLFGGIQPTVAAIGPIDTLPHYEAVASALGSGTGELRRLAV